VKIIQLIVDNREGARQYDNPTPWFGTAPQGLLEGFANLGRSKCEIHVVTCRQQPMAAPEKLADNIWIHSLHVPKIGWLRTGYQGCIRAVRKKITEIQPDIVHAQGTERDCAISAVFLPFPKVLTIHGNLQLISKLLRPPLWSSLALQTQIEKFCIPRFNGVLCITRYTEENIRDQNPRTWLLPNAATGSFFDVVNQPVEPMEILYIATVDERKNQNAFIDAITPLAAEFDFRVRFFGAGHAGSPFMDEFNRRMTAHSWCSYEGTVAHGDLRQNYARASILVLASLEDNCPMTVLEAMASGVAVMGSRVGGIPDLIEHEVSGLLCDPTDASSMRETLRRLLANPMDRIRLATAARERTLAGNHPTVIAAKHIDIYSEVLGRSGG